MTEQDWRGYEVGMTDPDVDRRDPNWHAVTLIRQQLSRNYQWARDAGVTPGSDYDERTAMAISEFQSRAGIPIILDDNGYGIADYRTRVRLGSYPPPPPPRHLAVVYRGTGGVIGQDYVSRVCQGASDLVREVNPYWPATMGGIPVGTAGGTADPSMEHATQVGLADGQRIIEEELAANPLVRIVIGGYSAGAVVAAMLREWLMKTHPEAYLCSFSFGDPTRPFGGAYFDAARNGGVPDGEGISSWHYGDVNDWRHCWLTNHGDMYANVPLSDKDSPTAGNIMQDAYDMVTRIELKDIMGTSQDIITAIPKIMQDMGIGLPKIFDALTGKPVQQGGFFGGLLGGITAGPTDIFGLGLSALVSGLTGLIAEAAAPGQKLTGVAAGAQAAVIALRFVASNPPTRQHISYEWDGPWPGQTYLGLAIQHVRYYASSVVAVDPNEV